MNSSAPILRILACSSHPSTGGLAMMLTLLIGLGAPGNLKAADEEPWTAALTADSQFRANSAKLSRTDRQVALRQLADQFSKALAGAPELHALEIKHRLLGIYGSLGDMESARAINKSLLTIADADDRRCLESNLAEIEASLALSNPESKEQSERALTQLDKGIAAALDDQRIDWAISLMEAKATVLAQVGKHGDAVACMRKAIDLCTNLAADKQLLLPPHERARLINEAMLMTEAGDDDHTARLLLTEMRQLKDPVYTPGRAVLEFHEGRNALGSDAFVTDALEILGGPSDPSFADLRMALCKNHYLPKSDHESIVKQLTTLLNEKELEKTSDDATQRQTAIANTQPVAFSMLAGSLLKMGEKAQAEFYYVELASGFPDHPLGKHARLVLENWPR